MSALRAIVYGSALGNIYGSARGSVRLSGSAAARQWCGEIDDVIRASSLRHYNRRALVRSTNSAGT
jgi:hypothetical protein